MREIEKKLLDQIDQSRRDLINMFNAATAATATRPPTSAEIRLEALVQAVRARGEGISDDTLVATAKAFENYLTGSEGS